VDRHTQVFGRAPRDRCGSEFGRGATLQPWKIGACRQRTSSSKVRHRLKLRADWAYGIRSSRTAAMSGDNLGAIGFEQRDVLGDCRKPRVNNLGRWRPNSPKHRS